MLMRLRMLKLSVGKGRQVKKQLCHRVLQYYATERAGYVLYRALVEYALCLIILLVGGVNVYSIATRSQSPLASVFQIQGSSSFVMYRS